MSRNTSAIQALSSNGIRKTALATSISLLLGGLSAPSVLAALPTGATLDFTLGSAQVVSCTYGTTPPCNKAAYEITDIVGSYFSMDQNGIPGAQPSEKTVIESNNGLVIGSTQMASGSHSGAPDGSESPNIDKPWNFFSNTGMHQTTANTTIASETGNTVTLNLPWSVTWNGIPDIPLTETGTPTISCDTSTCSDGSSYSLDAAYHVAGAGFTTVSYSLHLEGGITLPGAVPVAVDDAVTTVTGNPRIISVTANDRTAAADPFVPGSVTIDTPATSGTAADNPDDTVTYTPTGSFTGQDTFVYTVSNSAGASLTPTSTPPGAAGEQGLVTVDVQTNVAPVAGDDPVATNPVALDQGGGSLVINALANDTDANNAPGLPGGINVGSVAVTNAPGNVGACTANADGTITYSQTLPSVATMDSCTYTVADIDVTGPLTSNVATMSIDVQSINSDWPTVLPPGVIPILAFDPGVGQPDQSIKPDISWFSMQVSATQLIYTVLEPGPDGGFIIGYDQPATGSHTGKPNGTEQPGYSAPWLFFSNTGFDLTRNGGITGKADGTLDFRTKYYVTWNGIPLINLGGSSQFPEDLGFATITCSDKPCQDGSTFVLDYAAHVEDLPGASSGFNAVPYTLHLEGTVKFLDGSLKASSGTIDNETRVAASATTPDGDVDKQCVGSCFDYTISGVTPGSRVDIVLPLSGGVPNNPVWRILDNGTWRDFDTTIDSVKTAPFIAGGSGMECPNPGDAAYIALENQTTVNVGHQCVQLSITDDGANDLNKTPGIIEDPSGLGTAGTPIFVDNRGSDTSGCSIAATPVEAGKRADWWLLAGFLGWLGWNRGKRAQR